MKTTKLLFGLGLMSVTLAGCTMSRPPEYGLPSSDSVMAGETYTVGRNENLYRIAQKQGVSMRDIIALNQLRPPYALRQGQEITLPAKSGGFGGGPVAPTPVAAPLDHIDKGAMGPAADANGGAAGLAGVSAQELPPITGSSVSSEALNKPSAAPPSAPFATKTTSYTGLPQAQPVSPPPTAPVAAPAVALNEPLPSAQDVPSSAEAQQVQPMPPTLAPTTAAEAAPAVSTGKTPTFGWPVRGTIISAFGPKGTGLDNDGINISAPKGSPVKAAEGGMVAYAGNEMKGFGNLVLIKHEGGWVTAYAHLERLVVAKDTIVAKGDMIGTVGTTGGVSSPQLHFETRQDGKPVDPELMIK